MRSVPIACTLTDPEQRRRQEELQERLLEGVEEIAELADGYGLRFPGKAHWVRALAELIVLERACCPFLHMELIAAPESGPAWLKLRGPEGTKEFLERSFAICREGRLRKAPRGDPERGP